MTFAVAATIGVVSPGIANASDTDTTADLIASVAPDQGDVVTGTETSAALATSVNGEDVSVPLDASQPITLATPDVAGPLALEVPDLTVNLPLEVNTADGAVAADGTVVYHAQDSNEPSAAVQVLEDGSVRLQTVSPNADTTKFTYTFGENIRPVQNADGTIALLADSDGVAQVIGEVDEAWAVGADGEPVATEYSIVGDTLVQTLVPDASTTYPVVADPKVTKTWWNFTIYFNKKETNNVAAGASAVQIVGTLASATIVGAVAAIGASVIQAVAQYAMGRGSCLKLVAYVTGTALPQSYGGSEAGGYCK